MQAFKRLHTPKISFNLQKIIAMAVFNTQAAFFWLHIFAIACAQLSEQVRRTSTYNYLYGRLDN